MHRLMTIPNNFSCLIILDLVYDLVKILTKRLIVFVLTNNYFKLKSGIKRTGLKNRLKNRLETQKLKWSTACPSSWPDENSNRICQVKSMSLIVCQV